MTELTIESSEKYRPSNGTEGDIFMSKFCFTCKKCGMEENSDVEPCEILGRTFGYDVDDAEYPTEWTYDDQGNPICTSYIDEYEEEKYHCEKTPDLFNDHAQCEYRDNENNSK